MAASVVHIHNKHRKLPKISSSNATKRQIEESLKNCKLKNSPDFIEMVAVIEKHMGTSRLTSVSAKPQDYRDKEAQDTFFIKLLLHMLTELSRYDGSRLQESLNRVYKWFNLNKSLLYHQDPTTRFGQRRAPLPDDGATTGVRYLRVSQEIMRRKNRLDLDKSLGMETFRTSDTRTMTAKSEPVSRLPTRQKVDVGEDGSVFKTDTSTFTSTPCKSADGRVSNVPITDKSTPDKKFEHKLGRSPPDTTPGRWGGGGHHMRKWSEFQAGRSAASRRAAPLEFYSRSGVPYGIRYTAHDGGDPRPEDHTVDIIKKYQKHHSDTEKDFIAMQRDCLTYRSIESFYKHADEMRERSSKRNVSRTDPHRSGKRKASDANSVRGSQTETDSEPLIQKSLVENLVSKVVQDMNSNKEQMAPDVLYGDHLPSTEINPCVCYPVQQTVIIDSPQHTDPNVVPTWLMSLSERGSPDPSEPSKRSTTTDCHNMMTAQLMSATKERRRQDGNLATAGGSTALGNRPVSILPISIKDRWNSHKESDANPRLTGAASHHLYTIEPDTVHSMLQWSTINNPTHQTESTSNSFRGSAKLPTYLFETEGYDYDVLPQMEYLQITRPAYMEDTFSKHYIEPVCCT